MDAATAAAALEALAVCPAPDAGQGDVLLVGADNPTANRNRIWAHFSPVNVYESPLGEQGPLNGENASQRLSNPSAIVLTM